MTGQGPSDPQDGVYRAILMVLAASVVVGALLALLGDYYFQNEAIKNVGVGCRHLLRCDLPFLPAARASGGR